MMRQHRVLFFAILLWSLSRRGVWSFTATKTTVSFTRTTAASVSLAQQFATRLRESASSTKDAAEQDDHLMKIAKKLKLQVQDLEEGVFGFGTNDYTFGLEVVRTMVNMQPSIGLEFTEMAAGFDGRGLVLVSGVYGNAAHSEPPIHVGDTLTGVIVGDSWKERTTGLNYDLTVETIGKAKEEAAKQNTNMIALEFNRLVPRARVRVQVESGDNSMPVQIIEGLAGENLRQLLIRKGVKVYDRKTKRFDMPYATGDCGGEGLCGTCLVKVLADENKMLSPMDNLETLITRKRPLNWRASCRAVVGVHNEGGTLRIQTCPQSAYSDEINPGVRSVQIDD